MSQTAVPQTSPPPTTSPPPEYLRIHLTAPHIPPDSFPAVTTPIYCGELSGAITGGVHCFGYLQLGSQLVYLNMGGPRMAVEAIRARLSRGETIFLNPDDAPSVELINSKSGFDDYSEYMSSHHFQHTILLHRNMFPNYTEPADLTFAFILAKSPEQVYSAFHQHLNQLINLPVFPHWLPTLWATGMSAQIIEKCSGVGAVGYGVFLKASDWEHIISLGVSTGALPLSETGEHPQTVTILNIEAQVAQPSTDEPTSASADSTPSDPVYDLLKTKLPSADKSLLSTLITEVYSVIRKHAVEGWERKTSYQLEMHLAVNECLQNRLDGYTRDELAHIAHAIVTLAKTLNLTELVDYPATIDTDGKRALYRLLKDETTVLQLHEHIMDVRTHGWRDNTFKERRIKYLIPQYVGKFGISPETVFWVIKTHEEY